MFRSTPKFGTAVPFYRNYTGSSSEHALSCPTLSSGLSRVRTADLLDVECKDGTFQSLFRA